MFVIQTENGLINTDMGRAIYESILFDNWLRPESSVKYRFQEHNIPIAEHEIPVGTIEWTEKVSCTTLVPVNIPEKCMTPEFVLRGKCMILTRDELAEELKKKPLFIKSATKTKKYPPIITSNILEVPSDEKYFCTPVTDFTTEWRIFVLDGKIQDVRRYSGDWDTEFSPSEVSTVKRLITSAALSYPAYTVDIGRSSYGALEWIEVHPFISCGLYGFEDFKTIRKMATKAWKYHKEHPAQ